MENAYMYTRCLRNIILYLVQGIVVLMNTNNYCSQLEKIYTYKYFRLPMLTWISCVFVWEQYPKIVEFFFCVYEYIETVKYCMKTIIIYI